MPKLRNRLVPCLCEFPRTKEHRVEHGFGEDAREGVLLGGVVAAEEGEAGVQRMLRAVGESGLGPDSAVAQGSVPGEGTEAYEDPRSREQLEFAGSVR